MNGVAAVAVNTLVGLTIYGGLQCRIEQFIDVLASQTDERVGGLDGYFSLFCLFADRRADRGVALFGNETFVDDDVVAAKLFGQFFLYGVGILVGDLPLGLINIGLRN